MTMQALIHNPPASLSILQKAGMIANMAASKSVFARYREKRAENTLSRQAQDLALFGRYLEDAGLEVDCDFQGNPDCWQGITWGIVEGFVAWQLKQGYAVSSANVRLSTVKTYAQLAAKAGAIDAQDLALIQTVKGYSRKEGKRVDEKRPQARQVGAKKAEAVNLSAEQARQLTAQPDSPQGRRDALMMALLLEHGLRAGEIAALTLGNFDITAAELRFYRPKVDKLTAHRLTARTLKALLAYLPDAPQAGPLLKASRKDGSLIDSTLNRLTLTRRVRDLGKAIGIDGLSAHDCRHYCATDMAAKGYSVKELMEWFGWASPAMAIRYIADNEISERDKG